MLTFVKKNLKDCLSVGGYLFPVILKIQERSGSCRLKAQNRLQIQQIARSPRLPYR
jgi:hypothetical protein